MYVNDLPQCAQVVAHRQRVAKDHVTALLHFVAQHTGIHGHSLVGRAVHILDAAGGPFHAQEFVHRGPQRRRAPALRQQHAGTAGKPDKSNVACQDVAQHSPHVHSVLGLELLDARPDVLDRACQHGHGLHVGKPPELRTVPETLKLLVGLADLEDSHCVSGDNVLHSGLGLVSETPGNHGTQHKAQQRSTHRSHDWSPS